MEPVVAKVRLFDKQCVSFQRDFFTLARIQGRICLTPEGVARGQTIRKEIVHCSFCPSAISHQHGGSGYGFRALQS